MRSWLTIFCLMIFLVAITACTRVGEQKPSAPLDTLKAYTVAIKKKDTTAMKLLLSDASLKMAELQARAQNATVDDVVKEETLFTESQDTLRYRNEKIEGDRATIEVENPSGAWDTVPFVLEEGIWKIDKQAMANKMLEDFEMKNKQLDEIGNEGRIP